MTETESVAWTRLEMLGMLCACEPPFSFGDAGRGAEAGVWFGELPCVGCGGVNARGVLLLPLPGTGAGFMMRGSMIGADWRARWAIWAACCSASNRACATRGLGWGA